ncbi:MraY family glycosyltransferase [Actinomadura sp. WMMA1423]|uniref:MraY family glycosyltransferase n=1 Tax=Actinomadura sp. WMMA1423 TaxID=2591108 RepID=UPI00143DCFCA|nr:MraY family glycosyltransferase [Actinomadura sp. WMMA1423]
MTTSLSATAGAACAALLLTLALGEMLRRLALSRGLTDRPSARKAHERPTPYLGGVAIAAGTCVATTAAAPSDAALPVLAGWAVLVALLGLADDLRPLSPSSRLLVEGLAAAGVVASGGGTGLPGAVPDTVVTVLWIVLVTNAFNLLDNMDGVTAGVGAATAAILAAAAAFAGQAGIAVFLAALGASCAAFLAHNWPPARMFMGDAGSLFIGFSLASATVLIDAPRAPLDRITGMVLVTFVATVDTALVMVSRRRAGRSCLTGGTDHVAHRLRRLGLRPRQVASVLPAAAAAAGLCGLLVGRHWLLSGIVLPVAVTTGAATIWLLLRVPVYPARQERAASPGAGDNGAEHAGGPLR